MTHLLRRSGALHLYTHQVVGLLRSEGFQRPAIHEKGLCLANIIALNIDHILLKNGVDLGRGHLAPCLFDIKPRRRCDLPGFRKVGCTMHGPFRLSR
jgi:hypothetical protein